MPYHQSLCFLTFSQFLFSPTIHPVSLILMAPSFPCSVLSFPFRPFSFSSSLCCPSIFLTFSLPLPFFTSLPGFFFPFLFLYSKLFIMICNLLLLPSIFLCSCTPFLHPSALPFCFSTPSFIFSSLHDLLCQGGTGGSPLLCHLVASCLKHREQ